MISKTTNQPQAFGAVRLMVADPNPLVREGLRAALYSIGFRAFSDASSFIKIHDALEGNSVDLLITASEMDGSDVGYLIQEMRTGRLGSNPFVLVIVLLSNADPDYVKRVIDSGCDDLLLTPVAPDQLILRIEKLGRARKPFVVTHDYTGPDRRSKSRAFDSHSAPMLEVPNPLHARLNNLGEARLLAQISESSVTLNRIKIERHAVQIDWLVSHIAACMRDGVGDEATLVPYTHRLVAVAEDMTARMKGSSAATHVQPVIELLDFARRLDGEPQKIAFSDMERCLALSRTIGRALGNPPTAVMAAVRQAG